MVFFYRLFSVLLITSGICAIIFSRFIGRCELVHVYESLYGHIDKKQLSLFQGGFDLLSGIIILILSFFSGNLYIFLLAILLAIIFSSTQILSWVVKPRGTNWTNWDNWDNWDNWGGRAIKVIRVIRVESQIIF